MRSELRYVDPDGAKNHIPGALELAAAVLCKRWKPGILWLLRRQTLRFRELETGLGKVSGKVLTEHLRELERDGLIHRVVNADAGGRVLYSATETGKRLALILDALCSWGDAYHRQFPAAAIRYGLVGRFADEESAPNTRR